jgi:hypothetical protein
VDKGEGAVEASGGPDGAGSSHAFPRGVHRIDNAFHGGHGSREAKAWGFKTTKLLMPALDVVGDVFIDHVVGLGLERRHAAPPICHVCFQQHKSILQQTKGHEMQ